MSYYIIAGISGIAYGVIWGLIKYFFLWHPLILGKREFNSKNLMLSQIISMIANIIALLSIYFLRSIWPYSFEVTIIGAAVALALISRISPLQAIKKYNEPQKGGNLL